MKYEYYFIPNLYTKEECLELSKICDRYSGQEIVSDRGSYGKNVDVKTIPLAYFENKLIKVYNTVKEINRLVFGFDLYPEGPGYINFNRYKEQLNNYPYHRDSTDLGMSSDTKLTAVMNISDNFYQGGDFELFLGINKKIPELHNKGGLLIFPSFFYHRVLPVEIGERKTLGFWFNGKNYL